MQVKTSNLPTLVRDGKIVDETQIGKQNFQSIEKSRYIKTINFGLPTTWRQHLILLFIFNVFRESCKGHYKKEIL